MCAWHEVYEYRYKLAGTEPDRIHKHSMYVYTCIHMHVQTIYTCILGLVPYHVHEGLASETTYFQSLQPTGLFSALYLSYPSKNPTHLKGTIMQYNIWSVHLTESTGPVVASSSSVLRDIDVLVVVQLPVLGGEDAVDDTWLQVQQDCSRNIVLIVCLSICMNCVYICI